MNDQVRPVELISISELVIIVIYRVVHTTQNIGMCIAGLFAYFDSQSFLGSEIIPRVGTWREKNLS